jgi:hypothetical protein
MKEVTEPDYKSQLAQLLSNPKELVYDAEWLANVVKKYNEGYILNDTCICVYHPLNRLSAKDSAPIIMAALAKELNPLFKANKDGSMYCIQEQSGEMCVGITYKHIRDAAHIFTSEQAAQQAIDILTQIDPQILKNYFA